MKKLLVGVMLCTMVGCTSEVTLSDGKTHACVGVGDDDKEPGVRYKVSTLNAVLGIVFFETIFAPLVWLISDFQCPYALEGRPTI